MRKGETVSEESRQRMSEAHRKSLLLKLDVNSVPEKIERDFVVPSHRKMNRLSSVEEYLEVKKSTGWDVRSFAKNGYSKHQVCFFDFVLQDKLKVKREQFVEEYCVNAVELKEIAKKYGIPADYMVFVREHFGVKRIGSKGLCRQRETVALNGRQKSVVVGTTLGDGTITGEGSLVCKHSQDQAAYVEWLRGELEEHCPSHDPDLYRTYDDRYEKILETHSCRTSNHAELRGFRELFYVDGVKQVSQHILDQVDELALAVWFMDDGSTSFAFGEDGHVSGCESKLYTCSYTNAENVLMKEWFLKRWGLECRIRFKDLPDKNPYLLFSGAPAFRLLDIIRLHIIPSLLYKVDPQAWLGRHKRSFVGGVYDTPTHSQFSGLPQEDQEKIVAELFQHYKALGFPYFRLNDEEIKLSFLKMKNWGKEDLYKEDSTIRSNKNSSNVILSFQPHIFNMAVGGSLSPCQIFENDQTLADAIRRRLTFGGTCTPAGLRSVLRDYKNNHGVGNFPPSVAREHSSSFRSRATAFLIFVPALEAAWLRRWPLRFPSMSVSIPWKIIATDWRKWRRHLPYTVRPRSLWFAGRRKSRCHC